MEEDRAKREQDQKRKEMALQQQRLGKRPFPESSPYEGLSLMVLGGILILSVNSRLCTVTLL